MSSRRAALERIELVGSMSWAAPAPGDECHVLGVMHDPPRAYVGLGSRDVLNTPLGMLRECLVASDVRMDVRDVTTIPRVSCVASQDGSTASIVCANPLDRAFPAKADLELSTLEGEGLSDPLLELRRSSRRALSGRRAAVGPSGAARATAAIARSLGRAALPRLPLSVRTNGYRLTVMRLGRSISFGFIIGMCACSQATRVEPTHASASPPVSTGAPAAPPPALAAPPVAPVRSASDTYFGTTIVDPYRRMESSSVELDTWMRGQAEHTDRTLAAFPLQRTLRERVRALADGGVEVDSAQRRGAQLFYLKRAVGDEAYKLGVMSKLTTTGS